MCFGVWGEPPRSASGVKLDLPAQRGAVRSKWFLLFSYCFLVFLFVRASSLCTALAYFRFLLQFRKSRAVGHLGFQLQS